MNTRIPKMFSDDAAEVKLQKVEKITDFKNLGPASEKLFHKAGIKTAQQFIRLGWKKTWIKLTQINPKNSHTLFGYALIGALLNKDWNRLSDQEKQEAREFAKSLRKKT